MIRRKKFLKDNYGSTLVMVAICTAFITILCSILISISVTNRQMKTVDRKNKNTFYNAETAIDEIRTGMQEKAAQALEKAYLEQVKYYVSKTSNERRKLLAELFIDNLFLSIKDPSGTKYNNTIISSFLTNSSATLDVVTANDLIKNTTVEPYSLTLKNLSVSYVDSNGFKSAITFDLVINSPFADAGVVYSSPAFGEYALIADNKLFVDTAPIGAVARGNVYAGNDGISLDAAKFEIFNAKNVITRGDISVSNFSSLVVADDAEVWTKNILTTYNGDTSNETKIDITGKCYVADDMTLNAVKSNVKITGEYYGYSNSSSTLSAPYSSAIIVNGKNSVLDLTGVSNLMISGRAYLNPLTADLDTSTDIYTGESIAVKDIQNAYLVPKDFMWCGMNPVPKDIYEERALTGLWQVDYSRTSSFPISISDFVPDGGNKFIAFYDNSYSQPFVYYFIKFKDESKANLYMQKYYEEYNDGSSDLIDIDKRLDESIDKIRLNSSSSLLTAGNIFTYDSNSDLRNNSTNSASLDLLSQDLIGQYSELYKTLTIGGGTASHPESVFKSIVHTENLNAEISGISKIILGGYVVYIVNNEGGPTFDIPNDGTLPSNGRKGMVIANGDVKLSGSYEGVILSGKNIELAAGSEIKASKDIIDLIIAENNDSVNRYLRAFTTGVPAGPSSTVDSISISDLIVIDNWNKN